MKVGQWGDQPLSTADFGNASMFPRGDRRDRPGASTQVFQPSFALLPSPSALISAKTQQGSVHRSKAGRIQTAVHYGESLPVPQNNNSSDGSTARSKPQFPLRTNRYCSYRMKKQKMIHIRTDPNSDLANQTNTIKVFQP